MNSLESFLNFHNSIVSERDRLHKELESLSVFIKDLMSPKTSCPDCSHAMDVEYGCLHCEVERLSTKIIALNIQIREMREKL